MMARLIFGVLTSDLRFNRRRLALLAMIIIASLFTHVALGAILQEMQTVATRMWRGESPYDITVSGSGLDPAAAARIGGVVRAEKALSARIIIGSGEQTVLSLEPGQKTLALSLADGTAPDAVEDVALPARLAGSLGAEPGDSVSVLPASYSTAPINLKICGVFADKSGTPPCPIVTADGIRCLSPRPAEVLLVTLDGATGLDGVVASLSRSFPGAKVQAADQQYEGVQQGGGLASALVSAVRGLILLITAVALGALIWLVQRQRSFEFGLMKAMGAPNHLLIVPACLNILAVFLVSAPLTLAALLGARPLLRAPQLGILYQNWASSSCLFTALGVSVVLTVTWMLVTQSAARLLGDSWGRG